MTLPCLSSCVSVVLTDSGESKTPSWAVPLVVAGFLLALVLAVLLAVLWWQHRRLRYSIQLMSTDVYDRITADGEQSKQPRAYVETPTAATAPQKAPVGCMNAGKKLADDGYIDRQTLEAQQVASGHFTAGQMPADHIPMGQMHTENPAMHAVEPSQVDMMTSMQHLNQQHALMNAATTGQSPPMQLPPVHIPPVHNGTPQCQESMNTIAALSSPAAESPPAHDAAEELSDANPSPTGHIPTQSNFQDYVEPVAATHVTVTL